MERLQVGINKSVPLQQSVACFAHNQTTTATAAAASDNGPIRARDRDNIWRRQLWRNENRRRHCGQTRPHFQANTPVDNGHNDGGQVLPVEFRQNCHHFLGHDDTIYFKLTTICFGRSGRLQTVFVCQSFGSPVGPFDRLAAIRTDERLAERLALRGR